MNPVDRGGAPPPSSGGEGPGFFSSMPERIRRVFAAVNWLFSDRAETEVTLKLILRKYVDDASLECKQACQKIQAEVLEFYQDKKKDSLHFHGSNVKSLPDIWHIPDIQNRLKLLDLADCYALSALSEGIGSCKALAELRLTGCSSLTELPSLPISCRGLVKGFFLSTKSSLPNRLLNSFEHITRYIFKPEGSLEKFLKSTEGLKTEIDPLTEALEKGDWKTILAPAKLETLPQTALLAFYHKEITGEQFTTLMIYWSACSQLPGDQILTKSIFTENGEVDRDVKNWIDKTIIQSIDRSELGGLSTREAQLELFFKKMEKRPKSEQSFLYISSSIYSQIERQLSQAIAEEEVRVAKKEGRGLTDEEEKNLLEMGPGHICNIIKNRAFFRLLSDFFYQGKAYQMIPSLGMMQTLLEAQRQEVTITITPVIGLSSVEDIRENGLKGTREMGLPFPGVELPQTADGFLAPLAIDFIYHDFYHSMVANAVPDEWRKVFIGVADAVLELIQEEKDDEVIAFLKEFYEKLIDMEHSTFRSIIDNVADREDRKFLSALSNAQEGAYLTLLPIDRVEAARDDTYREKRIEAIEEKKAAIQKSQVISRLKEVLSAKNFWQTYGLEPRGFF